MAGRSVNEARLLGRLGRDAEMAFTGNGTSIVKFSVATSERYKDKASGEWKETPNWTNIVFWNGEKVAPYLKKGTSVYVAGRLQTRSYDDKDGKKVYVTEVIANEVILCGGKAGGRQSSGESQGDDEDPF